MKCVLFRKCLWSWDTQHEMRVEPVLPWASRRWISPGKAWTDSRFFQWWHWKTTQKSMKQWFIHKHTAHHTASEEFCCDLWCFRFWSFWRNKTIKISLFLGYKENHNVPFNESSILNHPDITVSSRAKSNCDQKDIPSLQQSKHQSEPERQVPASGMRACWQSKVGRHCFTIQYRTAWGILIFGKARKKHWLQ